LDDDINEKKDKGKKIINADKKSNKTDSDKKSNKTDSDKKSNKTDSDKRTNKTDSDKKSIPSDLISTKRSDKSKKEDDYLNDISINLKNQQKLPVIKDAEINISKYSNKNDKFSKNNINSHKTSKTID